MGENVSPITFFISQYDSVKDNCRLGCSKIPAGVRSETQQMPENVGLPCLKPLWVYVPQTPLASPLALASPFGRRGDATRTSRGTARAQWLPNLRKFIFLA